MLGVDVIGSAQLPDYLLKAVPVTISKLLDEALEHSGVEPADVLVREPLGDGAVMVLQSEQLGAVLDAAVRLDQLTINHNRWQKPEVRLRVAVHVGPVGADGFHRTRVDHNRLLDAPEFKKLLERCRELGSEETANTGLIVSSEALDAAFSGDHTQLARRSDFAALAISNKEFRQEAWVRVQGFDSRSLTAFTKTAPEMHQSGTRVRNVVHGNMHGVQAGDIDGNLNFYGGRRP
ncbi:hypothetical protein [Lentzea sp. NPDC060358]|uniref:hypothetical protein n=1 Tax=Lentzea sp. NPDC060358 TaxID=3347103 RepID=UPI0036486442